MRTKNTAALFLRRYGFIAGAATLLVVLVSWVAVRAGGPVQPASQIPLMVQPTIPLTGADPASLPSPIPLSSLPAVATTPPPAPTTKVASPKATTKPKPSKTTLKPSPRRTKTTPPAPAVTFTGHYTTGGSWEQGFVGSVVVTNKTGPVRTWTVRLTFAAGAGVRVGNAWNAQLDRQGDTFVFTGGPLAPGSSVTMGFQASKQVRPRIQPATCTVDGAPCQVG